MDFALGGGSAPGAERSGWNSAQLPMGAGVYIVGLQAVVLLWEPLRGGAKLEKADCWEGTR